MISSLKKTEKGREEIRKLIRHQQMLVTQVPTDILRYLPTLFSGNSLHNNFYVEIPCSKNSITLFHQPMS